MLDLLETIKSSSHEDIPDLAHDKFVEVYSQKFGNDEAETFFEEQKNFFINELRYGSYKSLLERADNVSLYFAFMFLAINGLSLEKCNSTTCYLECRRVKIGEDPNKKNAKGYAEAIYQNNAVISITGYGEIILRQRAGQIKSVDSPKIVYDCDTFRYGESEGSSTLLWEKCLPRPKGSRLIACYVRIVKNDGSVDYFVLDIDEILRLKQYSDRFNFGKPNPLYGKQVDGSDIDTGFLKSKTIKHAFKGYPKLRIGAGGVFESEKDMEQEAEPASNQSQSQQEGVIAETTDNDPFNS